MTQEELKKAIYYDPETGHMERHPYVIGANRMADRPDGRYEWMMIDGISYPCSHLAVLYMTGAMPPDKVDHKNGIRNDNRWDNLRLADDSENARNRAIPSTNSSGVMGVRWEANKYRAQITFEGVKHHLGMFDTLQEAVAARKEAEARYGFHPNHGRKP